jgi:hypothetical protein
MRFRTQEVAFSFAAAGFAISVVAYVLHNKPLTIPALGCIVVAAWLTVRNMRA